MILQVDRRNREYKLVNNQIYITQVDDEDKIIYDGNLERPEKSIYSGSQDKHSKKLKIIDPYKAVISPKRAKSTMKLESIDSMNSLPDKKLTSIKSFNHSWVQRTAQKMKIKEKIQNEILARFLA